jgi:hypothetical protein
VIEVEARAVDGADAVGADPWARCVADADVDALEDGALGDALGVLAPAPRRQPSSGS